MHDEIACLTEGASLIASLLDKADAIAALHSTHHRTDIEAELSEVLPAAAARLSPEAREFLHDYNRHVLALVAGLHAALAS
jgi:hypothetical protein